MLWRKVENVFLTNIRNNISNSTIFLVIVNNEKKTRKAFSNLMIFRLLVMINGNGMLRSMFSWCLRETISKIKSTTITTNTATILHYLRRATSTHNTLNHWIWLMHGIRSNAGVCVVIYVNVPLIVLLLSERCRYRWSVQWWTSNWRSPKATKIL